MIILSSRKVKASLQRIRLREAERMSVRESVHMEVLIDKFSVSCPFRPLDMFDVNFSTAASLAGLVFTYVIVLMQFREGDAGSSSVPSPASAVNATSS